jgi:hypothetical protein
MRRRRVHGETEPVVLPRLTVRPGDDGFTLTLDGNQVAETIPRAELGHRIAATISAAGSPVRVDVHDRDGGIYSDIILPPPNGPDHRPSRVDQAAFAVHYRGFLAGEEVVIAVVDQVETANRNGAVTLSLTRELLGSRQLVLFGRVSGTTFVAGST